VTPEQRRARYADALRKLSEFFPSRCTEKRKGLYFQRLCGGARDPDDVDEAVERLIASRETDTFPPWAALETRLVDVASSRRQVRKRSGEENLPRLDTTEEGRAAMVALFRKWREIDTPKPQPNIRTDREHRRKVLGIKPLTQAEIDDLNRRRQERARAREQEEVPF